MKISLPRHLKYSIWAAIILSTLTLFLYAYLGSFMRMITDDYCSVFRGLEYGVVQGVIERYLNWSSRYSSFFVEYALAPQRPMIHPWLPFITILAWLGASYYAFTQFANWLKIPQQPRLKIGFVLFFTFSMYILAPLDQHIFWFAAVISYNWVFILSLVLLGNFIHYFSEERSQIITVIMSIYAASMVFFLGGLSEIQITMMITIFTLMLFAIAFVPMQRRREYIILVSTCLAAAMFALVIVFIAPGPKIRQDVLLANVPEASLVTLLSEGVKLTLFYIFGEFLGTRFGATYALANLGTFYCTFIVGGLILIQNKPDIQLIAPHSLKKSALVVGLVGFILIASTTMPMVYASRTLPFRSLIFPRFIQLWTVMAWAYLTVVAFQRHNWYHKLSRTRTWPILAIVMSLMIIMPPIITLGRYISYIPNFQAYAQSWDERNEILLNAEEGSSVVVEPLAYDIEAHLDLERLGSDPSYWINQCAASYYGLEGIEVQK